MHFNLHTNQFYYGKNSRTFSADASELGFKPGMIPAVLSLTSERTGNIAGFTLNTIDKAGGMEFEPVNPALKKLGVSILIFND